MLTKVKRLCSRLHAAYIKYLINQAEIDACVIQAEAMAAPAKLISTRSHITDLKNRLAELEV